MTFRHPLRDRHKKRKKGDTAQLAAQLAPLEEQDTQAARRQGATNGNGGRIIQEHGALIVDTDGLRLPKELTEKGGGRFWEIEPVVLVVVLGAIAFIAFIAWQISQMPPVE
jgi:hypothetical protein